MKFAFYKDYSEWKDFVCAFGRKYVFAYLFSVF